MNSDRDRLASLRTLPACERERLIAATSPELCASLAALLDDAATLPQALASDALAGSPLLQQALGKLAGSGLAPGDRVGAVTVVAPLGGGGMGSVYRGFDHKLERAVAIKTIHPRWRLDAAAKERFRSEARILSRLNHPGICQIYDLVEGGDQDCLLLEFVDGRTLRQHLEQAPPDAAGRLRLAHDLVDAVAAAHRRGVVHRDLKPDNVMVTAEGAIKVLDFGISLTLVDAAAESAPADAPDPQHELSAIATRAGAIVGTLGYMSPEQASGEALTPASDIYALGLVLRELFGGERAYPELPLPQLIERVRAAELEPAPSLPKDVAPLIADMLALQPEHRPPAEAVRRRLEAIAQWPERARRRRLGWITATAVAALVALSAWLSPRLLGDAPLLDPEQPATIALLPIENATGSSAYAWAETGLVELATRAIEGAHGVRALPVARMRELAPWRRDDPTWLAGAARTLGASLVVSPRLELHEGRARITARVVNVNGSQGVIEAETADPSTTMERLVDRLLRRTRPQLRDADLRRVFAADPLINRLYATGVQADLAQGPDLAAAYARVLADQAPDFLPGRALAARVDLRAGRAADAARVAAQLLEAARTSNDARLELEALLLRGRALVQDAHPSDAATVFDQAIATARALDPSALAQALLLRAGALRKAGQYEGVAADIDQALSTARSAGDLLLECDAHNERGLLAMQQNHFDDARAAFERLVELARSHGLERQRQLATGNLAHIAFYRGDLEQAHALLPAVATFFEHSGDTGSAASALQTDALVLAELGRKQEAEAGFRRVIALAQAAQLGDTRLMASFNLADLLVESDRVADASPLIAEIEASDSWIRTHSEFARLRARLAFEHGDFAAAVAHMDSALVAPPAENREHYQRLRTHYALAARLGRRPEAAVPSLRR
ncbi:MAG: protein kinase [Xanthomonadales bacterium]|nr:protein kinase [Xanthomonadales bacterium]